MSFLNNKNVFSFTEFTTKRTGCIFESPEREDLLLLKVTAETTFVSQFCLQVST